MSAKDSITLAFTISNELGEFQLSLDKSGDFYLAVNALGYELAYVAIPVADIIIQLAPIKMQSSYFMLDEVRIIEQNPVYKRSDTLIFNLDFFRDSMERNVGELLNKIPGVEVDQNGKVAVHGRSIKNIQIDGDDITGSQYQLITNTMNAQLVKEAQIMMNHQDNPLIASMSRSEGAGISINLITKDSIRNRLNSEIIAAIGTGHYDPSVHALALFQNLKGFIIAEANNIGKGLGAEQISYRGSPFSNTYYSNRGQDLTNQNQTFNHSQNWHYRPSSSLLMRISSGLGYDDYHFDSDLWVTLFNGQLFRNEYNIKHTKRNHRFIGGYLEKYIRKNSFISFDLNLEGQKYNRTETTQTLMFKNQFNPLSTNIKTVWIWKPSPKLLLSNRINYSNVSSRAQSLLVDSSLSQYEFFKFQNSFSSVLTHEPKIFTLSQNIWFKSGVHSISMTPNFEINTHALHFNTDSLYNYNFSKKGINATWHYEPNSGVTSTVTISPQNNRLIINSPHSYPRRSWSQIGLSMDFNYKASKFLDFKLTLIKNGTTPNNFFIGTPYYMYDRWDLRGNQNLIPEAKSFSGKLEIQHLKNIPLQSIFSEMRYDVSNSTLTSKYEFPAPSVSWNKYFEYPAKLERFNWILGFDRLYTRIKSTLGIKPSLSFYSVSNIYNNTILKTSYYQYDLDIYLRTGFNLPINAVLGYRPSWATIRSFDQESLLWDENQLAQAAYINFNFNFFKILGSFKNYYYSQVINDVSYSKSLLGSFNISKRINNNRVLVEVRIYNLYHSKNLSNYTINSDGQLINNSILLPRMALLYIVFNL